MKCVEEREQPFFGCPHDARRQNASREMVLHLPHDASFGVSLTHLNDAKTIPDILSNKREINNYIKEY
jgi:hypothetical protein